MATNTMIMLRGAQRRLAVAQQQHNELLEIAISEIMQQLEDVMANGATEFRGVLHREDREKYISRIKHNRQMFQVGSYDTPTQAAAARLLAELDVAHNKVPRIIGPKHIDQIAKNTLQEYRAKQQFVQQEVSALKEYKVRIGAE